MYKRQDGHTVTVGDETLTTGYILLATGTTPLHVLQNVDSDVTILTTDELLSIEALPESLAIIGGGVIGCEIANIFASFGVSVTIIELMPTIVPMVDKEISVSYTHLFPRASYNTCMLRCLLRMR